MEPRVAAPHTNGYLLGDDSHAGAAHDFVKLSRFGPSDAVGTGVLLIGLDSLHKSMDADVMELQSQGGIFSNGWSLVTHRTWADRRNAAFRINFWFWYRDLTQSADHSGRTRVE